MKGLTKHHPLPYVVALRVSLDHDSPPTTVEREVLAYSMEEAVFAAIFETVGLVPEKSNVVIEKVAPNLEAWFRMLAQGLIRVA